MPTKPALGTIISNGTLRDSDLLEAYVECLEQYRPKKYAELVARGRKYIEQYPDFGYVGYLHDGSMAMDEIIEELSYFIHEQLINALYTIAPANGYFGASYGDGSCIGFFQADGDAR